MYRPAHLLRTAFLATVGVLGGIAPVAQAHEGNTLSVNAANCIDATQDSLRGITSLTVLFSRMKALPITGRPVARHLQDPAHRYQVCLDPTLPHGNLLAAYLEQDNRLVLPMGKIEPDSFFHEAFHGYQDTRGGLLGESASYAPADMAVSVLLSEAAAVGYSLMALREAAFNRSEFYAAYIADDANAFGTGKAFDDAFNAAYAQHAGLPEEQRRTQALQAGGTVVVESLLSGSNKNWSQGYLANAMAASAHGDKTLDRTNPTYVAQRNALYRNAGSIGDSINIVPARFLGSDANSNIDATLTTIGISSLRLSQASITPRPAG